nr:unnamed protein product [Digitaria exilis]
MVAGSIKEELAIAVPAEMLWKAAFATGDESSLRNLFAGLSNAEVKIDGDGEPGSIYSLKFNPEGGEMAAAQLKSQVVKCKVEPAVAGGCVAKVTIEYESLNGRPLSPVDEAKLMKGYVGLMKKMEENMVAYS